MTRKDLLIGVAGMAGLHALVWASYQIADSVAPERWAYMLAGALAYGVLLAPFGGLWLWVRRPGQ